MDLDGDGRLDTNEDIDGDGRLDSNEDLDGDGVPTWMRTRTVTVCSSLTPSHSISERPTTLMAMVSVITAIMTLTTLTRAQTRWRSFGADDDDNDGVANDVDVFPYDPVKLSTQTEMASVTTLIPVTIMTV